jgi:hypothetical protein
VRAVTRRSACAIVSVAALASGCGGDPPCEGYATCVALTLDAEEDVEVDQLQLDLIYGFQLGRTLTPQAPRVTDLPVVVPIRLGVPSEPLRVSVVVGAERAGVLIGYAAGEVTVEPDQHVTLDLELGPVVDCGAPASLYCNGATPDKPGLPSTVYECRPDEAPVAHGRCPNGCNAARDACAAGPDACVGDGFYCGGDKIAGDPQVLYTCDGSVAPRTCDRGCRVQPQGFDDCCVGDAGCGPL